MIEVIVSAMITYAYLSTAVLVVVPVCKNFDILCSFPEVYYVYLDLFLSSLFFDAVIEGPTPHWFPKTLGAIHLFGPLSGPCGVPSTRPTRRIFTARILDVTLRVLRPLGPACRPTLDH